MTASNLKLFRIFICAVDLLYRLAVMLVVKIRQMAPLYQIKLLLNMVQIAIFSIQWPWCVQKNRVNIWSFSRYSGKCRVAPFLLDHPVHRCIFWFRKVKSVPDPKYIRTCSLINQTQNCSEAVLVLCVSTIETARRSILAYSEMLLDV